MTRREEGQSVAEVLVALAIFVLISASIVFLILDAYSANRQGAERSQATLLAQEGVEASRSLKTRRYGNLSLGDHGLSSASGAWGFSGLNETIGKFSRTVNVAIASRDGSGNLVESGGTPDFDTRRVTTTVRWLFTPLREGVVAFTTFFTNWRGQKSTQTTQADFDAGTKANVRTTNASGGEVQLDYATTGTYGNEFRLESVGSVSLQRTTDRVSMRFTAQTSASVTSIRVYLHTVQSSPTYRFGLQADDGNGIPSGTWLASATTRPTASGWLTVSFPTAGTITAGSVYHLVVQYESGIIGATRRIAVRVSQPRNFLIPLTQIADAQGEILQFFGGEWLPLNRQPIYVLGSAGGFEGNPYTTSTEQMIAGSQFIGEVFTVAGGSKTIGSISAYVRKSATQNPADDLTVVLEDLTGGGIVDQGVLVARTNASTTYRYETFSFVTPILLQDGRAYRLSLRSVGSTAAQSYRVWRIENDAGATYDDLNAGGTTARWTSSANSGMSWTDLVSADIGGYRFSLTSGFAASGDFVSSAMNTGSPVTLLNYLAWTSSIPVGTTLTLQIRTASTQGGLASATWVGPDGTASTFFTQAGESITVDPGASGTRWVQYRILYTSSGSATPVLSDVTIDYEFP